MVLTGPKSRCWQDRVPSGRSRGQSAFLPFAASRGSARPPAQDTRDSDLHFCGHTSDAPTPPETWVFPRNAGECPISRHVALVTCAKPPVQGKVTYSQVPGVRMQTVLPPPGARTVSSVPVPLTILGYRGVTHVFTVLMTL